MDLILGIMLDATSTTTRKGYNVSVSHYKPEKNEGSVTI